MASSGQDGGGLLLTCVDDPADLIDLPVHYYRYGSEGVAETLVVEWGVGAVPLLLSWLDTHFDTAERGRIAQPANLDPDGHRYSNSASTSSLLPFWRPFNDLTSRSNLVSSAFAR